MNSPLNKAFRKLWFPIILVTLIVLSGCPRVMCDCASPFLKVTYRDSLGSCLNPTELGLRGVLYRDQNSILDSFPLNAGEDCSAYVFFVGNRTAWMRLYSDSLGISDTVTFQKLEYEQGGKPCECLMLDRAFYTFRGEEYVSDSFVRILP